MAHLSWSKPINSNKVLYDREVEVWTRNASERTKRQNFVIRQGMRCSEGGIAAQSTEVNEKKILEVVDCGAFRNMVRRNGSLSWFIIRKLWTAAQSMAIATQ